MRKRTFTRLTAAAALGLLATTVGAQTDADTHRSYAGISYFDWESDTPSSRLSAPGMRVVGGYDFNRQGVIDIGVEGHIATGGKDDLMFQGEDAEAELTRLLSLFLRPSILVARDSVRIYGLLGYSQGKVDVLAVTTASDFSESGFSWGGGVDIALTPNKLSVNVDYVQYIDSGDIDASAMSLGLKLHF